MDQLDGVPPVPAQLGVTAAATQTEARALCRSGWRAETPSIAVPRKDLLAILASAGDSEWLVLQILGDVAVVSAAGDAGEARGRV